MNRNLVELSVGVGAITVPWWMQLTAGLEVGIAVGGLVPIGFCLAIAVREWRGK